jgi:hypothetical protein
MQAVCQATASVSSFVKERAFECLVKLVTYYYDYMFLYMQQALYGVSFSLVVKFLFHVLGDLIFFLTLFSSIGVLSPWYFVILRLLSAASRFYNSLLWRE